MSTPSNAEDADKNARLLAAAKRVCLLDWTGHKREDIAAVEELRRAVDSFGYVKYEDDPDK